MDSLQQPSTGEPFQYPAPWVVMPTKEHRRTFTLLHGRGSNGDYFGKELLEQRISEFGTFARAFPDAKFIFPTAAFNRAKIYRRSLITQWFDNWHLEKPNEREELQIEGPKKSTHYIHELLKQESYLVGTNNVALGGLSQGCATALISLLLWDAPQPLPIVFGICGWLPFRRHIEGICNEPATNSNEIFATDATVGDDNISNDAFVAPNRPREENIEQTDKTNATGLPPKVGEANTQAVAFLKEMLDLPEESHVDTCLTHTKVFLVHGKEDGKVSVTLGREAAECLKALGIETK